MHAYPGVRRYPYRAHRGQTLIVALAVLFILLFIGAYFVTQIARNLANTGRSRDTQQAISLADEGVNFADDQLTHSDDGADWRPAPTLPMTNANDPNGVSDPDYQWLSQGFERVSANGGRFLIHVTYDPKPDDPRSQMLRVEAIGRPGDLGNGLDPTVNVQNGPAPRLRAERVAYKQIGLTDYLLYVTNKDLRSAEAVIGTPAIGHDVATVLGDPTIASNPAYAGGIYQDPQTGENHIIFGGPIRCNTDLRITGDTYLYQSPRGNPYTPAGAPNTAGAGNPQLSSEGVYVSGSIFLSPTRKSNNPNVLGNADGDFQATLNQSINSYPVAANNIIRPSDDPLYSTIGGLVRDGSTAPDAYGYTRSVPRLDPPALDSMVKGVDIPRYRNMTRNSGKRLPNGYDTGEGGWGTGVYINNPDDVQSETSKEGVVGSYSLRADWLNPHASFGRGYWDGPFYRPPGVLVELLGDRVRITRYDGRQFTDPLGNPITASGGSVIEIPLRDTDRANYVAPNGTPAPLPPLSHDGDDAGSHDPSPAMPPVDKNSYGVNLVIYAEGNVRVKGVYGAITDASNANEPDKLARVHLTIVSNATAYIEGNVVKGDGYLDANGVLHPEHGSTCAIMATDYVCVNPTVFTQPQNQTGTWSEIPGLDAFSTEIGQARQTYDMTTSFGVSPATYTTTIGGNAYVSPFFLALSHAALDPGPSYTNIFVNPALEVPIATTFSGINVNTDSSTMTFDPLAGVGGTLEAALLFTYPLGLKYNPGTGLFLSDSEGVTPTFERRAFALLGHYNSGLFFPDYYNPAAAATVPSYFPTLVGVNNNAAGLPQPGYDNVFRFALDQRNAPTALGAAGSADYMLGGAAITPMDIRIEALIYAQNRSFFVIPGYAANPDPNDSRINNANSGTRSSYSQYDTAADRYAKDVYPFYNEPQDIRITIFGAVAENYTATMGDQAAWMNKWGYIPANYGSSALPVPDDHMHVHDAVVRDSGGNALFRYNPSESLVNGAVPTDFRTGFEQAEPITRGLRFEYDPAFAYPYMDASNADETTRQVRALRYRLMTEGYLIPNRKEQLPPMPKLPVCPGIVEFNDDLHTIG